MSIPLFHRKYCIVHHPNKEYALILISNALIVSLATTVFTPVNVKYCAILILETGVFPLNFQSRPSLNKSLFAVYRPMIFKVGR
jgi:hypothetical protein